MAAVDKTYYTEYKEYKEVRDWCSQFGIVQDKYGNRFNPLHFLYEPDLSEEEFEKRKKEFIARNPGHQVYAVLWNTPTYFDIWLIRNCNLPLIVKTLKDQYSEEYIERVKQGKHKYDTYQRNGLGKRAKITVLERPKFHDRGKYTWSIELNSKDEYWWYREDCGWVSAESGRSPIYFSSSFEYHGSLCLRSLIRKIRSWDLPEGIIVTAWGNWQDQTWKVLVRNGSNSRR